VLVSTTQGEGCPVYGARIADDELIFIAQTACSCAKRMTGICQYALLIRVQKLVSDPRLHHKNHLWWLCLSQFFQIMDLLPYAMMVKQ